MKKEIRKVIMQVMDNIISQYINQLKEHRDKADFKYPETVASENNYVRTCRFNNVIRCDKGIAFAGNIRNNLDKILYKKSGWTRKGLIKKYHDNADDNIVYNQDLNSAIENSVADNVYMVLDTFGLSVERIMPTILGYALLKKQNEFENDVVMNQENDNIVDCCKLTCNYGKDTNFDILQGLDSEVRLLLNMDSIYNDLNKYFTKAIPEDLTKEEKLIRLHKVFTDLDNLISIGSIVVDNSKNSGMYQRIYSNYKLSLENEFENEM